MGHETRLKIIQTLAERPKGMSSTDIADHVGVMPTNTSSHLSVLRTAGLISSEKAGRIVTYRLEPDILHAIIGEVGRLAKF